MARSKDIPDSDIDLFRSSIGKVTRIKHDKVVLKQAKRSVNHGQSPDDINAARKSLPEFSDNQFLTAGDEVYFKRPGIQQRVMEKLRRGQFAIEKELDLHGLTVANSEIALEKFLAFCQQNNYRCIRIIHGKGLGSGNKKPVLKNKITGWLQNNSQIMAFCSARPADGGTGAVYVLLKRS